ncbi:unnamed protein product [Pleuronectes platessa]|uniref:non-specific serine/threonine protein kinase n=1 Tax=Pleuronectes platessa TaxID=8262 RepID=A0A9N7U5C6_PLEPL|nr:unnamed protein product [Pleuronectes platessa]
MRQDHQISTGELEKCSHTSLTDPSPDSHQLYTHEKETEEDANDGAPLSELSWPSSLAVVAVSFSGLFTFVFLMLACLCCKKGRHGLQDPFTTGHKSLQRSAPFSLWVHLPEDLLLCAHSLSADFTPGDWPEKEFENTEGEEYQADLSVLASPSAQNGPEVYILPLTEVSLPVSKQPGRSIQLLKSSDLGRHSLLYLKEIGHGWFGKVLLGEVNVGLSTTQVVVKELKASASVQDQMQFLEEVQPYRTLQHPALLQCLAQCSEVTPYLLVMEFCPLGDLKSYLRGCRLADSETPDPLILQRMACDIASGLLHLHKYNFIHSDLALRNCLLTSEMSVKIGDYGFSHSRYKDDYYITQDQIWVALRWIAPELIDEVHGNLLVVDQTKSSNIWSLGVTVWELFELGNQPYRHYSDRQVLTYAVKEEQLKLPKPHLQFPLAERWYEVMQFCWLQPELRPSSEEVHLLVTYLCAKGSSEAEEDFEQRWNALRPNLLGSTFHTATSTALILTPSPPPADVSGADQTQAVELASSASSSFPLLEHFNDSYQSDTGDDLLTVTETSHGLNFEYKWELARAEQPYCSSSTSGPLGQGNPYYQDIYYSSQGSTSGGCKTDSLTSGTSLSYYEPEHPGVVPVLSAHSPSVSSEYYIRIEEPVECKINLDDSLVDYSPGLEASNSRLSSESRTGFINGSAQCLLAPSASPVKVRHSHSRISSNQEDAIYCAQSSAYKTRLSEPDNSAETNHVHPVGRLENTRSLSNAVSSPSLGFCDPYLEASTGRSTVNDSCPNVMGPLRKTLPIVNHISIDVETDDGLLVAQRRGEDIEDDLFSDSGNWTSNHSANNNSDPQAGQAGGLSDKHRATLWEGVSSGISLGLGDKRLNCPETLESGRALDGEVRVRESSFSLIEIGDYSEDDDDDLTDITSGIFADFNLDYAEVEEDELSPLKNLNGTPDSVDTLNLSSSMASHSDQAFSPDPFNTPILPKSLDSGYDTENNESPEFFFKELGDPRGGDRSPSLAGDPEFIQQVGLSQGACTSNNTSELKFKSLTDKNPYRDSAYFSDYDAENERSPQEKGSKFFAGTTDNEFHTEKFNSMRNNDSFQRKFNKEENLTTLRHIKSCAVVNLSEADPNSPHPLPNPGMSMLTPFPPEMGGCLTKESAPAEEDLGLETEHSGEEPSSELSASIVSEPASTVQDTSANHVQGNRRGDDYSPVRSLNSDSTLTDCGDEAANENENGDGSTEEEELPEFSHIREETENRRAGVTLNEDDFEDIDAEECDSQDSICEESNGPVVLSTSSSLLELCGENVRAPLEEAEDEDDSDDSESDEELRTYNIQDEDSEESEEDFIPVPVVVSDCSRARHLRSLLKMPPLLTQSCDELERKKKAVSFFDGVTVFLFDQESPTGELADYTFATGTEESPEYSDHRPHPDPELEAQAGGTLCDSEETDGSSEKDGSYEWEDDLSPDPLPEPQSSPTSTSNSPEAPKPAAVALNRFMVSRFSITQVSDSHIDSTTGGCEHNPKD